VKVQADDLFHTPLDQAEIDFENEGGETYLCGNPPYLGKRLYTHDGSDSVTERLCDNINPYLVDGPSLVVDARRDPPRDRPPMLFGNMPRDGGNLIVSPEEKITEANGDAILEKYLRRFVGSEDFIQGKLRYCPLD
jgi:hypothetical protein